MFSSKLINKIGRFGGRFYNSLAKTPCTNVSGLKSLQKCSLGILNNTVFESSPRIIFQISPCTCRNYAKGKDKKKEKAKGKVTVNETQIAELVNVETLKFQMQKAVEVLEEEFIKHLSLRSTTGAIESISVTFDGKEHTLQELAQIVRKNPKTIVVNFATFPQVIPEALKAIHRSGMNLNPQQDGTTLFIPIPKVTKEHREQLSKNAKQIFVKCRESIKDIQQKYIKQVKKKDKVSEDLARSVEQQIVALGDKFIAEAESLLDRKQTELVGKE